MRVVHVYLAALIVDLYLSSLLQKPLHYRGVRKLVLSPFVVAFGPVFARAYGSRGCPG
jgi:hypothetical protein